MSEPVVVPDLRTNVLRQRKYAAATRADAGPGNLAPHGGNPLSAVLSSLETAWVSPSDARRIFAETLDGTGSAVPGAFRSRAAACRSEAAGEPVEVDHNDPSDGWKADASRIDARITGMLQNPYRSGGY
jgi:hypothetical protein